MSKKGLVCNGMRSVQSSVTTPGQGRSACPCWSTNHCTYVKPGWPSQMQSTIDQTFTIAEEEEHVHEVMTGQLRQWHNVSQ